MIRHGIGKEKGVFVNDGQICLIWVGIFSVSLGKQNARSSLDVLLVYWFFPLLVVVTERQRIVVSY